MRDSPVRRECASLPALGAGIRRCIVGQFDRGGCDESFPLGEQPEQRPALHVLCHHRGNGDVGSVPCQIAVDVVR